MENKSISALPWIKITCRWFWNFKIICLPQTNPYNGTLWAREPCAGATRPGVLRLPTGGDGEALEPAQRCCWTSFRSPRWAGGAQRGTQTERRVVENAESWSWPEQRPPFQAWSQCSAHLQLRQQAGRARQGSLGTRTFRPEAWEGRADTPDSADSPFGALTLNAEVFSLSQESRGENRSQKGEKDFLEL